MQIESLKIDDSIKEGGDSLGGAVLIESGLYDANIEMAYLSTSKGGAMALNVVLLIEGESVRQTIYMTSGTAKGALNYYIGRDGQKVYLPGFQLANSIALLTVGKDISDVDVEEKVIKLWDYDAKGEVPTKVKVFMELLGKKIKVGMIKQIVDKNVKNDDGTYVPSGETRDENEISKVFHIDSGLTVTEIKAEATEPGFITKWVEKWKGVTKNKAKGAGSTATSNPAATSAPKPAKSLFGN